MKIIIPAAPVFESIMGLQRYNKDESYKKSEFLFPCRVGDDYAVYNSFNGMLALMSEQEYNVFSSGRPSNSLLEQLVCNWFYIKSNTQIFEEYKKLRGLALFFARKNALKNFTVLTTTDCNARCFYCYEKNLKRISMDNDCAEKTAEFIAKSCNKNAVRLNWFGGEPLYNLEAIDTICNKLNGLGIKYRSKMISNALLFDRQVIEKAKKLWRLRRVQITLDGTEENYNRIKAYISRDAKNPFARVIDNIGLLTENNIFVDIRLNISENNIDDMAVLVDFLAERFTGTDKINVVSALLYQLRDSIEDGSEKNMRFSEKIFSLNEKIFKSGLYRETISHSLYTFNNCMADSPDTAIISPDGRLYKCEHYVPEENVGDINTGITDTERLRFWKSERYFGGCRTCAFTPICNHLENCENIGSDCGRIKKRLTEQMFEYRIINSVKKYLYSNNNS